MNKKLIRLTENDLHRIVKESVNRILMESKGLDPSKRDNDWFEKSVKESRFSAYKYANNPLLSKDEAEYWDNLEYPSDKEYNNMLRLIKQYDKNALYKMLGHDKYNAFMCRLEEDNPEIYKEYTHLNPDELSF